MGAYSDRVIADGASYYWRLGEPSGTTATDSVGGAHGTISGGVTLGTAGGLATDTNTAMTLDGLTGKIVTTTPIALLTPVTCEAWVRAAVTSSERGVFSTRNGPSDGGSFVLVLNPGGSLYLYHSLYAGTGATFRSITDGRWHHLILLLDGTAAVRIYLDGTAAVLAPLAVPYGPGTSTHVLAFGHDSESGSFLAGTLDEVAVYPRALTPAEISAHNQLARATADHRISLGLFKYLRRVA